LTGNAASRLVLDQGYEYMHVGEVGMGKAADDEILAWSLGKSAIV
jgi:hypothetical protein